MTDAALTADAPTPTTLDLAVIPGDGIGPEVIAEALKVLEARRPQGRSSRTTDYDLGAERYLATGEMLPDSVLAEIAEHDAILLGAVGGRPATRTCRRGSSSAGCCCGCASSSTTTSTCARRGSTPARRPRCADPGEVDFVVVREGTEGPYVGNGGALRVGTPHEIATEVSVNTALRRRAGRPRRVRPGRSAAPAEAHPGAQDQRARPRRRRVVAAWSARSAPEFPDVSRRLPARRRRDDLHGHRPGALRRDRHRQPVRRHHHRPRRRHHRRHRAGRQRQHQPRPHRTRACSSRCTAPPRTSPGSRRPTRPRRSCRWRCCSTTSGSTTPPGASRTPSWPTSPSGRPAARVARRRGRRRDRRPPLSAAVDRSARRSRTARRVAVCGIAPCSPRRDDVPMSIDRRRPASPRPRSSDERLAEILANPGFGVHFTDHMVVVEWTPRRGWHDARVHAVRARSRSTRRRPSCTTRRRSSRA